MTERFVLRRLKEFELHNQRPCLRSFRDLQFERAPLTPIPRFGQAL